MLTMSTEDTILRLTERVAVDEARIGVLSTGERLAVALVLDRHDLLGGYTMLQAVERLGPEWTRAARLVQDSSDFHRRPRK